MDDLSNINFEINENRPIHDNHKVNDNDILNGSAENKLSAADSNAFLHSSPLTEKLVLTSVNNNFQNEKPNISVAENSIRVMSHISGENTTFSSSEVETSKDENTNNSSLSYETPISIGTGNNISCRSMQDNSGYKNELNDFGYKAVTRGSNEIPEGNVEFPQDALSDEIVRDNQKNLSINAALCNELSVIKKENVDSTSSCTEEWKEEKNNSYVVVPDLVDFSFREQENVSGDLLGSFTTIDSLSKQLEPSPNSTLEEIPGKNPTVNVLGTCAELLEADFSNQVPKSPTNIHEESGFIDTSESGDVLLQDSINTNSPLRVSENPVTEVDDKLMISDNVSVGIKNPNKVTEEVSVIKNIEFRGVNSDEATFQVPENTSINKPDEVSPLKVERVSFGMPDKSLEKVNSGEVNFQVPENTSINKPDEISPLKVERVSFGIPDKSLEKVNSGEADFQVPENTSSKKPDGVSPLKLEKVSFGMSDKSLEEVNSGEANFQVPENTSINKPDEVSPLKLEKVSLGMPDKSLEKVNSGEADFQVPENTSNKKPDGVSPLKLEKVSFGMSDKSLEEFSDSGFESKVPDVPSNNPQEQFSDPHFAFKVPEVPLNNPLGEYPDSTFKVPEVPSTNPFEQFSDPDFAFKVPEAPSNNPLEQFSGSDFDFKMPENPASNEGDEQFMDAVQFFKDPNSFQFLENIRTSTVQPGSTVPRSSLYVNFDPLHSKFQANGPRQDNCELITAAVQGNNASVENSEKCSPEVVNKNLVDVAARESLGNILISFDSPKSSTHAGSEMPVQIPTPPKMFTEEEVQHKLKIHELETQDTYIKKQREMEMEIAKRDEILKAQRIVIEEFSGISAQFSEVIRMNQEKIASLETENEKQREDLKTSAEDLQSVENTFTDFYKRYEQCKGMLKTYKDNEEHLKQTILDMETKAKEQEQMYHMLQERTEEMLEKANLEVDNVKHAGDAQVTVLKAQLKKAEMKISSLESDIKQIKIENSQLGGICDDLMAKVSRS